MDPRTVMELYPALRAVEFSRMLNYTKGWEL